MQHPSLKMVYVVKDLEAGKAEAPAAPTWKAGVFLMEITRGKIQKAKKSCDLWS